MNLIPMAGDERDPDRQMVQDLRKDIRVLSQEVKDVSEKLSEMAVLANDVAQTRDEIRILRKNIDGPGGVLDRVAVLEARVERRLQDESDEEEKGGIYISKGWLTVLLGVAGVVAKFFWDFVTWVMKLLQSLGVRI